MDERNENIRRINEMALEWAKKYKSSQTGYLHYYYGPSENGLHYPIPLVENFLYALALLRSRTVENINEAKILLNSLLYFQNRDSDQFAFGNFPIYLHEFPICKDRFLGIQIGMPIFWMLKSFDQVLGFDLKKKLEDALTGIIKHGLSSYNEKSAPYINALKIAALAKSTGIRLKNESFYLQGESLMENLIANPDYSLWYCPQSMGAMLSALAMVYPRISESPWKSFWKHLEQTWHRHTGAYIGPALKSWQCQHEPEVTLYDLFLGYFSGTFPNRIHKNSKALIEGALIPYSDDLLTSITYPLMLQGDFQGSKWHVYHGEKIAYSLIENRISIINPSEVKGFHPFRLVWGSVQQTHSFVCQCPSNSIEFNSYGNVVDLTFTLNDLVEVEDREKSREIAFFIDVQEGLEFLVSGSKASIFYLGETVSLNTPELNLELNFSLKEGEGKFFGHRMMGNRPSQIQNKGSNRFDAFDWQIFLRTVFRQQACLVHVSVRISEKPSI